MKNDTKKISLDISVELLERIDQIAKKGDITRSKLVSNILEVNIKGLEGCGRIGLLQTSILIRDLADSVGNWAKSTKGKGKTLDEYEEYVDKD